MASDGSVTGAVVEISQPADQNAALALVGSVEWVMLDYSTLLFMLTAECSAHGAAVHALGTY